ncbi:PKD domain-containing protein [Methanolacinia paynteri]
MQIPFILNQGQQHESVKFYANTFYGMTYVTDKDLTYSIGLIRGNNTEMVVLKEQFIDNASNAISFAPVGEEEASVQISYFKGSDPSKWQSGLPVYNLVCLGEIYSNITVKARTHSGNVEKLFFVEPGGNPDEIKVRIKGSNSLSILENGSLSLGTVYGEVIMSAPKAYQNGDEIPVKYIIIDENTYGFIIENFDCSKPLLIDPSLDYSTFIGGSEREYGKGIFVDNNGNIYATGYTASSDFPITTGVYQSALGGNYDLYVLKLNSEDNILDYATYLGGTGNDYGYSLTVDDDGNAYITGNTASSDFPTTTGAYQTVYGGDDYDVFVSKLNSDGTALDFSTFLGGEKDYEYGYGISVDDDRNVYITGYTRSSDFPITADAYQIELSGTSDAFVSIFNPDGSNLVYSTYFGGSNYEYAYGIDLDNEGSLYVTGRTKSNNYPVTADAYQNSLSGSYDAFLFKMNIAERSLTYSTYLGGTGNDYGYGISVDDDDDAYITGYTKSPDFPVTVNANQDALGGGMDVFVSKLNLDSSSLDYSTYLGGSGDEEGSGIVLDGNGNACITGYTDSSDFPVTADAYQSVLGGDDDVFVLKLNSDGNSLDYSTYLGGSGTDQGSGISIDDAGSLYVTGYTADSGFPVISGAYQNVHGGGTYDAFILEIVDHPQVTFTISPQKGNAPLEIVCNGTTVDSSITGYMWVFGDDLSQVYSGQNITHTFSIPGNYDVRHAVVTADGTYWKNETGSITVGDPVTVNFTTSEVEGYAPLSVSFNDTSESTLEITGYEWIFSDDPSTVFTGQNATHVFESAGIYDINHSVMTADGTYWKNETGYITVGDPVTVNFTTSGVEGYAPLSVSFNDTSESTLEITGYKWIFSDDPNTVFSEQNVTHVFESAGIYDINHSVITADGTYWKNETGYILVESAEITANFTTDKTSGSAPLTIQFNDTSTGNVTEWAWDFEDDGIIDSDLQNPSFTYTSAGDYTVNLTLTGPTGSDTIVKKNLINVSLGIDLSVASVSDLTPGISNTVTATITNNGTDNAGAFKVNFTFNETTTIFEIDGIDAGDTTSVYVIDTLTTRKYGDIVPLNITIDTENSIVESNEANNEYNLSATVARGGTYYFGGRYYTGSDIETGNYTEGNISVIYSLGDSGYQTGGGWYSTTVTWTGSDLPIPEGATVKAARLYQSYTWNGEPGFTVYFNGNVVDPAAMYYDGNVDDLYMNGQGVYDVTPYFNTSGNTAQINAETALGGLYGTVLVVVYEDSNEPYRWIWLDEGCDTLYYNSMGAYPDMYTGYAIFDNLKTENIGEAKIITVLPSGGDNTQATVLFNNQSVPISGGDNSRDPAFKYYYVIDVLKNGTNELGVVQGDNYMNLALAILELTELSQSKADFTAGKTSGITPLTVQFTDTSTGTPATWEWDFGDGGNSTERNPSHTYTTEGSYTVTLNVSNSLGSDIETKTEYINVGSTSVAFETDVTSGQFPLTIQFTDQSVGSPTAWHWDFGDGENSTNQNPVHTYLSAGKYDVNLTVTGSDGTDSLVKEDYISVEAITGSSLPLTTEQSGTVSGDLYVGSFQPVPFANQASSGVSEREFVQSFKIPNFTSVEWARVYVNIYSGSGSANWPLIATTMLDGDGNGVYETTLGVENMDMDYHSANGKVYWLNNHTNRVYSDYEIEYDVTDLIASSSPKVHVKIENKTTSFDGRLKALTLIVAYNEENSDEEVLYWVNHGGDWIESGSSSTTFGTSGLTSGFTDATLSNLALSSKDGSYTFNSKSLDGANPVKPLDYYENHTWSVTDNITQGSDSIFSYNPQSGSSFKTTLATLTVKYSASSSAPSAAFTATPTSGKAPLTVQFTDNSVHSPASYEWDFDNDGNIDSTEENPSYVYTTAGTYSVNLTVKNENGEDSEVKSGYITVTSGGSTTGSDLSLTGSVVPVPNKVVFAWEPNTVYIENILNSGTEDLTNIKVSLYANDVSDTEPVNWTTINSLKAEEGTSLTFIDPTIRKTEENEGHPAIMYIAVVDPDDTIAEIDESNNRVNSTDKQVKYNGYKGKTYWTGASNITTRHTYELSGDMIYYTQPSSTYEGVGWKERTETWTAGNLLVPDDATVEEVLLFVSYNWDQTPSGLPNWTTIFNGYKLAITPGAPYTDKSNFGTYAEYTYGLYVVDVTDYFSRNGNTFTMTPQGENLNALYPSTLVVIYSDSSASMKQIFINEECDELGVSLEDYGTTEKESTAYAPFTGMDVNKSSALKATLYSFAGSAGSGEGKLYFNGALVASDWSGDIKSSTPLVADVKSRLENGENEAEIQGTESGGMCAYQQILVVDYGIVPEANFTASPVDGNIPFEVKFTDNSTAGATSYEWEFGDGGNSTEQNPTHEYIYPGTYSVRLSVSNENGTTSCLAERLINAAWPSIPSAGFSSDVNVGKSPLAVSFTDRSTNSPTSWLWEFGDGSSSTEQNLSHTYTATRLYTVNLTAYNSDGNSTITKPGYIEVVDIPELPGYNDIYVKTANTPEHDKQANGTYYIGTCGRDDGLSDLHISTSPDSPNGSKYMTDSRTGEFYVTYTGSHEFQDDIILMLAVNGTVPEDFAVDITASGNKWTPSDTGEKPESIASSSINRAFAKADFTYGLQDWKPAAGNTNYPMFPGEDMNETCNTFRVMFIDLKLGVLGSGYEGTENKGAIRVVYSFTNLTSFATFNVYGWNQNNSGQQAIIDTNSVSSGYSVYTTPVSGDGGIVPDFSADNTSGEIPLNVTFTDLTSVTPASWLWEFGDGANSTEENPSHTYTMPGVYSVNLTISNSKGTNNTLKVNYISVNNTAPPVADFISDETSGMEPLTVKFTDNSTGNITSWKWEFGDGGTSTEQNPSHTYNDAGDYSVRLTVKNSRGTDSILKRNYIGVAKLNGDPPAADFSLTPASGSAPLVVVFTDTSANSPTGWKWDFENDGIIDSTAQNPSYTYRSTGTYSVALTVSNKFGSDTVVKENAITISGVKNSTKTATVSNSGTLTENSDGSREYSINTSDAGVSGNDIVINSGNCVITIKSDKTPVENGGSYVSSNVTGIELRTDPVETTMDDVGDVSGSVNVSLNGIPGSASLEVILDEGDSGVGTAFQLAAGSSGLDVSKVAYTMNIVKTNLENGQDIKEARITMSVPVSWVDANGGISSIKIIRIAEDGTKEVLNTTYVGMSGGLMVFEGYSPNGLSLFGLAATQQKPTGSGSSGSDRIITSRGRLDYKNSENPSEVQSSEEGKVLADTRVPSDDGLVAVFISKGTLALDKSGNSIDEIVIEKSDEDSVPENDDSPVYEFMGRAYDFKPSGATFSPGIDIIFYLSSLGEYQAFDGKEPVIRYYNKAGKEWEDLKTTFDEDTMTVSATASHFSIYGLFAMSGTGLSGEQDASAGQTSNAATREGTAAPINSHTGTSSASSAILVLFTVGFVSIVSLGTYRFRKSRMEEEVFGEEK